MRPAFPTGAIVIAFALSSSWSPAQPAGKPEEELAGTIKTFFQQSFVTDWSGIEKFPNVQWAPLPPAMLQNCLPDGGCFTRQGRAAIGGRNFVVIATGARTIVSNVYFRNMTAPVGEAAVVEALKRSAFTAELARCPIQAGVGGTDWYRIKSAGPALGYLSIQTSCAGKPCEGFILTRGEELPPLQPNQLRHYTENCSAAGADRTPVSTVLPHEQLAEVLAALIPQAASPPLHDWIALRNLPSGVKWNDAGAKKWAAPVSGEPDPWADGGQISLSGRQFYIQFLGSPTQVKTATFEEGGMHPRGENLLGELYKRGFAVKLVRCGPVYTESTNNWYSITSSGTRPVMLRQSIRYEGNQVQDSYELRLDASLPARDARDRDPGVGGCS
jgi:hypothetical protein